MSTRSPPSALEPYLQPPPETSLHLLTSTLGCSVNWLVSQYVAGILGLQTRDTPNSDGTAILLVSWLRDAAFWKTEIRRTTGLDVARHNQSNRFVHIDCFSQGYTLKETEEAVETAIQKLQQDDHSKVVLILDNPDVLLATASATTPELNSLLLKLRSIAHDAVVSCAADLPLVQAAASSAEVRPTPIESETAAFVTSQAHAARLVLSVRELDTGAAKDVSGVLRVTRGGSCYDLEDEDDGIREAELLYLVQRDGTVKVFNRGADAG